MSWEVGGYSDAGQLDHPITFLAWTETTNDYGEVTYSWAPYADDWAAVRPLVARERLQAQQLQGVADYALRVRWRPDITEQHRVRMDGQEYDLAAPPVEVGRHRFLDLLIRRRDAGQPDTPGATRVAAGRR